METPLHEYKVGWSLIVVICILFAVNMGYMVSLTLTDLLRKCYLKKLKKQAEQRRKQLEAEKIQKEQSLQIEQVQKSNAAVIKKDEPSSNTIVVKTKKTQQIKKKVKFEEKFETV